MKRLALVVLAALLAAGSGAPAQTQYYLLRSDDPGTSRPVAPSERLAMGVVSIAPYIDQAGIVMETAPGEIHPARAHQWAEPVPEAVRRLLRREISNDLGIDIFPTELVTADTYIDVRIDQLHGTSDGEARLVADWGLRRGGEIIETAYYSESRPLAEDGYAALARACEALLVDLAGRIAASLKSLDEAEPGT